MGFPVRGAEFSSTPLGCVRMGDLQHENFMSGPTQYQYNVPRKLTTWIYLLIIFIFAFAKLSLLCIT